ncbi:MAG: hypothetical protein R3B48_19575 [Kofleriaceae bacterium]
MKIIAYVAPLVGALMLTANARPSDAAVDCSTFFWTASQQAPVERYQPRYLIGEGLEDVHMSQIVGTRIRYKWSAQAASCIAASNRNGYFYHPAFNETACLPGETCFPGTRPRSMSERLGDMLDFVQRLATPNANPTYQANLDVARASSYVTIDALSAAPVTVASFYTGLVNAYGYFIDQLTAVEDLALPANARTAVMDALCSVDNVAQMDNLINQCFEADEFCNLAFLFDTINMCQDYQSGATLDQVIGQVVTTRTGLVTEQGRLAAERNQIVSLWGQVQALRPNPSALPAACNIRYSFGTAQLPQSSFPSAQYGADLRYLYGDWEWPTLGVSTTTAKSSVYVRDVANLVSACIGDPRYGRLDFRRRQVANGSGGLRDETDAEYYARALGDLVGLRAQFASVELNYASLLHTHAPLVPDTDVNALKTLVSGALTRTASLTANRTTGLGWVVVLMQEFLDASERFTEAQEVTRALITVYSSQFPGVRDLVIDRLVNNTEQVLDQYGQFFSEEKRLVLEGLLADAVEQGGSDDVPQVILNLNAIADSIQAEFNSLWDANQPLGTLSSQLKFIYGSCTSTPTPHPLLTYFGDLPVAQKILQEGNDAQLCSL